MHISERSINIFISIATYLLLFPEYANAHSFDGLLPVLWPCMGVFALAYAVPSDSRHLLKVSLILLFITIIIIGIDGVGAIFAVFLIPFLIVFFIVGMAKKFLPKKK